jgi:hypothetical protein
MKLVDANPRPHMVGLGELPGKVNYFIGNDPTKWRTNIPTYQKIKYQEIYPGVDLVYYGNHRQLEYDFIVAPGADPNIVTLDFEGADKPEIDTAGDLVLHTTSDEIRYRKPFVYQEGNGKRIEVAGTFKCLHLPSASSNHKSVIGFQVGSYDTSKPLIIDPVMVFSSYLGGSGPDGSVGIAVDSSGSTYVVGFTDSDNFPIKNPFQQTRDDTDVFVAKLNPTGSALIYCTYLGGSGRDSGSSIAVDADGNAYVTGFTASTNFPTVNPLQSSHGGGDGFDVDALVLKLNPTGSALVYSTYLGGSSEENCVFFVDGGSIAVDADGNAYVTGFTGSNDFPTVSPLQPSLRGHFDAFVAKLNPTGSALVYSTYLGGSSEDASFDIAVDTDGNVYLTGLTDSTDFPTVNPLQPSNGGGDVNYPFDALVLKLSPTGSALVYSTYLGGNGWDVGSSIATDVAGNAYVTGFTASTNFPTVNPLQPNNGGADAFVAKLNPTGSALAYSTYLGGSGNEVSVGIAIDTEGNAYVTGATASTDFPTARHLQLTNSGGADAFVAKLNPTGAALAYSTYLGGSGNETFNPDLPFLVLSFGRSIAVDTAGNAYVTGRTRSSDFPTMLGAFQPTNGGGDSDAFIVKIQP